MRLNQLESVLTLSVCLTGCSSTQEARDVMDRYTGIPVSTYVNAVSDWAIYDKAAEGRIMIAQNSTLASPASAAFGRAVTFGDLPRADYQAAVEGWLASNGRMCTIRDGNPIIMSQWEFTYSCR